VRRLRESRIQDLQESDEAAQLGDQAAAVGVTLAFSFLATLAILRLVDRMLGICG
jgi:ammonia channel protein AmtB